MKVCAGIVLYNPCLSRLKKNIESIINQVDDIVVIDNGSSNYYEIKKYLCSIDKHLYLVRNTRNYGIAKALNQILEYALTNGFDAYLTLDQDSISSSKLVEKYLEVYSNDFGQITCNIIDRNSGIIDKAEFHGKKVVEVEHCITSGCINNTKAVKACGGYRNSLFIDGVDLDLSYKLRKHGYPVICINYNGLLHELGNGKSVHILWKKLNLANHYPWRNYYTRRNLIYVAKKYYSGYSCFAKVIKQIIYSIGIIVLEDNKKDRIKYNCLGIYDGLRMNLKRKISI